MKYAYRFKFQNESIRINVKRLVHNLFYQPFNVNKCTLFVLFISFCKIRHETSLTEVEI